MLGGSLHVFLEENLLWPFISRITVWHAAVHCFFTFSLWGLPSTCKAQAHLTRCSHQEQLDHELSKLTVHQPPKTTSGLHPVDTHSCLPPTPNPLVCGLQGFLCGPTTSQELQVWSGHSPQ